MLNLTRSSLPPIEVKIGKLPCNDSLTDKLKEHVGSLEAARKISKDESSELLRALLGVIGGNHFCR